MVLAWECYNDFENPYLHSVTTPFVEYNLILFEVQSVFISLSPTDNIGSAPAPPFAITWAHKTTITTLALPHYILLPDEIHFFNIKLLIGKFSTPLRVFP